jgi:hypothetical protein
MSNSTISTRRYSNEANLRIAPSHAALSTLDDLIVRLSSQLPSRPGAFGMMFIPLAHRRPLVRVLIV